MNLPLKWEFPGGKVEPDEDEEATIVRVISEELHLNIEVVRRLEPVEHDYPTFRIRLVPFVANVLSGKLQLEEHVDAKNPQNVCIQNIVMEEFKTPRICPAYRIWARPIGFDEVFNLNV